MEMLTVPSSFSENNIQDMIANQAEIQSLQVCRVDDTQRPREKPKGDGWGMVAGTDVAGSYRLLRHNKVSVITINVGLTL
jgi:hypothetical protein